MLKQNFHVGSDQQLDRTKFQGSFEYRHKLNCTWLNRKRSQIFTITMPSIGPNDWSKTTKNIEEQSRVPVNATCIAIYSITACRIANETSVFHRRSECPIVTTLKWRRTVPASPYIPVVPFPPPPTPSTNHVASLSLLSPGWQTCKRVM